jgi:hypothetical protein
MLGCSQYLHPFLGKIRVETGERESGSVNSWLANFTVKPDAGPFQLHLQLFGVRIVKAFNRDNGDTFLLIACGRDRLGPALFRH